ncbi:MFS transporter [Cohnella lupini]|nr:MFS transporter [Cohnella lupini]
MYSYATPFMESILHMNESAIGIMMLTLGVFSVIGSRMGGKWADKWGTVRMIIIGLSMLVVALALLPLISSPVFISLLLISFWIFSMAMTIPVSATRKGRMQQIPLHSPDR